MILLGFSVFLAKESFAEVWSALVKSGLEPACNKEIKDVQGHPVESWEDRGTVGKCSITQPRVSV